MLNFLISKEEKLIFINWSYVLSFPSVSCLIMSSSLRPYGLYIAHQAPLSLEFSREEYWSGELFFSPEDLPFPGIKPDLPHCRWILIHLSHQGCPRFPRTRSNLDSEPLETEARSNDNIPKNFIVKGIIWITFLINRHYTSQKRKVNSSLDRAD